MANEISLTISVEKAQRLDTCVFEYLKNSQKFASRRFSRAQIQGLIKSSLIKVNGNVQKAAHKVRVGDKITIELPTERSVPMLEAEDIGLNIIFQDKNFLVVNKVSGMATHPGPGNETGTLANAAAAACKEIYAMTEQDGEHVQRPGIVHRLDKDTSGCIALAKNLSAMSHLAEQFAHRQVIKFYLAVVNGIPDWKETTVENFLARNPHNRLKMKSFAQEKSGAKAANSAFFRLATSKDFGVSLILCKPKTGRTHQLRVHLKENLNLPILGDEIYGTRPSARRSIDLGVSRLMLHSFCLVFFSNCDERNSQSNSQNGDIFFIKNDLEENVEFLQEEYFRRLLTLTANDSLAIPKDKICITARLDEAMQKFCSNYFNLAPVLNSLL